MRSRRGVLAAAGVVAVAATACLGTPDTAFNGGVPVHVVSSAGASGPVLRFPGGATFVSRFDSLVGVPVGRMLEADGSLDAGWAGGGELVLPFVGEPIDAAAHPDGALTLVGWLDADRLGAVRVSPSGELDSTFGTGGFLVLHDGTDNEPAADVCSADPAGGVVCADASGFANSLRVMRYSATGAPVDDDILAVDYSDFARGAPPGAATLMDARALDVTVSGQRVIVAQRIVTLWVAEAGIQATDSDLLLASVGASGLDVTFGEQGHTLIDLEVDASGDVVPGPGDWSVGAADVWIGADAGVGVGVRLERDDVPVSGFVKLTSGGDLDAAARGGGMWSASLADGTPVLVDSQAMRSDGTITAGGTDGVHGVIVRFLAGGALDTAFDGDGTAVLVDSVNVHAVDVANGRVTAAGTSGVTGPSGEVDLMVSVLLG